MIQQYLNIVQRWLWLLILASIGCGAVAYSVTSAKPAVYEATSRLIVGPGISGVNPDLNAFRAGGQLMRTYAELATTRPVLESVATELQSQLNSEKLKEMISVKTDDLTQILSVRVRGNDADQVVTIANAVANHIVSLSPAGDSLPADQVKANVQAQIQEIKSNIDHNKEALKQIEEQSDKAISVEEKRLLFDQLNQIRTQQTDLQRILAALYDSYKSSDTNQTKVIELAIHADKAASTLLLATIIAALAGFIVTLTLVFGFEYFNDTIRTISDLAYAVNIPVLATIVKHKRLQGVGRERFVVHALPDSRAVESYRVLSSKLLLSRFQDKTAQPLPQLQTQGNGTGAMEQMTQSLLRSIVISGTQANENISEIAANLAVVLAQTGHRVILVDAYLHRPSIHHLFGIQEQRGLADILLLRNLAPQSMIKQLRQMQQPMESETSERTNMVSHDLHENAVLASVEWAPGLQILTSGTQPANPFELLVSPHMADLIKSLERQADLVIIAASPLLASADSLILASRADGVLIAARSDKTRRDTLKEIVSVLNSLNAHILGTVLNQQQEDNSIMPTAKAGNVPTLTVKRKQQTRSAISA